MVKTAVIGATGFTGEKLIDILLRHPEVDITYISGMVDNPSLFSAIFPRFKGKIDLVCDNLDVNKAAGLADVIFLSLPHRVSFLYAPHFMKLGKTVIDLSADYRFKNADIYKVYYGEEHKDPVYLKESVYGLPEFFKKEISRAKLVANPGCYPTVSALCLAPLLMEKIIRGDSIIIDAKSGISGAGRNASLDFHYAHLNQNLWAYKVFGHQHTPEINQVLSGLAREEVDVGFTPHLVPLERGIYATIYASLVKEISREEVMGIYKKYYSSAKFVRLFENIPRLKDTVDTNFCDISAAVSGGRIIVAGCIDNLIKGAGGQAVQNMNIIMGFDEETGLS